MFERITCPTQAQIDNNTVPFVRFEFGVNGVNCIRTEAPRNPYVTGYGRRIPTQYMVRVFDQRWHRVYVVQYSNAGTTYVTIKGKNYIVDIW